jgi:hypothetical protein
MFFWSFFQAAGGSAEFLRFENGEKKEMMIFFIIFFIKKRKENPRRFFGPFVDAAGGSA